MLRKLFILLTAVFFTLSVTACKPNRPKGCPKLYPCTIQVIQGGAPLEGATATLYPEDSALIKWPITGLSDAEGKIVLMTQTYPGVPLGKYKVTVTKEEIVIPNVYHLVDEKFNAKEKTPAEIEVVKGMTEPVKIDVGNKPEPAKIDNSNKPETAETDNGKKPDPAITDDGNEP